MRHSRCLVETPPPPSTSAHRTAVGSPSRGRAMFVQTPPQQQPSTPHNAAAPTPFTPHEHALFVEGVEAFCNNVNNGAPVGEAAWRHIALHVRTRTPEEVKAHAQYYLMSLQSRNPEITRVPPRPAATAASPRPPPVAREAPSRRRAPPTTAGPPPRRGPTDPASLPKTPHARAGSRRRRGRGPRRGHRRRTKPSRTRSRSTTRATPTDGRRSPRCFRPSPPPTCSSGTSGSSATSSKSSAGRANVPRARPPLDPPRHGPPSTPRRPRESARRYRSRAHVREPSRAAARAASSAWRGAR